MIPRPLAAALLATFAAMPAAGQSVVDGRTRYEAAYFAPFAPANALQIVERVPGFRLEEVDQEVRGFGQAAGNVVINGQRPSAKSETLATILSRIPATQVLRVEVGPGDLFASELSGKPQVVNLVLSGGAGLSGTIEGTLRRQYDGSLAPEGSVSVLLRRGFSTFNVAAGLDNEATGEEGFDVLTALPSGERIEFRRKVNAIRNPVASVSASWAHDAGANRTAHLNLRIARDWFRLTQDNDVFPAAGPARDDRLTQRFRTRDFEVGGDITRPLLGGALKLIGLATRRTRDNRELSLNRIGADVVGGSAQDLDDRREETVLRLVWSHADLGGWSVEAGAEGVLNRLRSRVDFFALQPGGARVRIDLPVDDAVVKEWRGEGFVNAGRALSPRLRVDIGMTYEASRLTVRGDAAAERTLRFLKPKASLDWRPGGRWRLQASAQRTVAQLQFEDFVSAAELTSERVNGGNPELVPQRAWELLLVAERPILGDGLLKLEAGYERVSLVQDRVPTPEGFDAPGNLDDGDTYIGRVTVDAPLASFGFKGARFSGRLSVVEGLVVDPYTGRRRRYSGNSLWVLDASLRQDLGRFAWGISASANSASTLFRRNEEDRSFRQNPYVSAFVEYRPDIRTTLTLGVDNLTDAEAFRERTFFLPTRATLSPSLLERRVRNQHLIPFVSVRRSLG